MMPARWWQPHRDPRTSFRSRRPHRKRRHLAGLMAGLRAALPRHLDPRGSTKTCLYCKWKTLGQSIAVPQDARWRAEQEIRAPCGGTNVDLTCGEYLICHLGIMFGIQKWRPMLLGAVSQTSKRLGELYVRWLLTLSLICFWILSWSLSPQLHNEDENIKIGLTHLVEYNLSMLFGYHSFQCLFILLIWIGSQYVIFVASRCHAQSKNRQQNIHLVEIF